MDSEEKKRAPATDSPELKAHDDRQHQIEDSQITESPQLPGALQAILDEDAKADAEVAARDAKAVDELLIRLTTVNDPDSEILQILAKKDVERETLEALGRVAKDPVRRETILDLLKGRAPGRSKKGAAAKKVKMLLATAQQLASPPDAEDTDAALSSVDFRVTSARIIESDETRYEWTIEGKVLKLDAETLSKAAKFTTAFLNTLHRMPRVPDPKHANLWRAVVNAINSTATVEVLEGNATDEEVLHRKIGQALRTLRKKAEATKRGAEALQDDCGFIWNGRMYFTDDAIYLPVREKISSVKVRDIARHLTVLDAQYDEDLAFVTSTGEGLTLNVWSVPLATAPRARSLAPPSSSPPSPNPAVPASNTEAAETSPAQSAEVLQ